MAQRPEELAQGCIGFAAQKLEALAKHVLLIDKSVMVRQDQPQLVAEAMKAGPVAGERLEQVGFRYGGG